MKTGLTWIATSLAIGTVALSACGKGGAPAEGAAATAGGEPAIVITDQAEWDSLAQNGKVSFDRACGACHPGGDADLGPAIKGHMIASADMTKQIREGSGRMKPVGTDRLPDEEMKGLMVYLATLQAVGDVKGP